MGMDTVTKIPIQVHLYPEQVEELEAVAARWHVSLEDVVRQSVASLLFNLDADEEPEADDSDAPGPLEAFIGLGRSDVSDLAVNHDKYLMECEERCIRPASAKSS